MLLMVGHYVPGTCLGQALTVLPWRSLLQDVYEQLVEREKRVKGQEASVSAALGERERSLQARQDQLAAELQERERRLRGHEDECLATDRQLTADKAALDRARSDLCFIASTP